MDENKMADEVIEETVGDQKKTPLGMIVEVGGDIVKFKEDLDKYTDVFIDKNKFGNLFCQKCSKTFSVQQVDLAREHVEIHMPAVRFHCAQPGCGRILARSLNLKNHMKKIHGISVSELINM